MWLRLRNTARRGRSGEPERRSLIRSCRFWRAAPRLATCVIVLIPSSRSGSLLAADLAGLAGLAADDLAEIVDALALVRLGLSGSSDLGGNLADQLLVDPGHREVGRVFEFEADAVRRHDLDRVAVAEVQLQLVADLRGAIADTCDLERLAVAVRHADHHVGDERSGKAMELLVLLGFAGSLHCDGRTLHRDTHVRMEGAMKRALWTLDGDVAADDRNVDAGRNLDRQATNS